jgi:hypothetical protein
LAVLVARNVVVEAGLTKTSKLLSADSFRLSVRPVTAVPALALPVIVKVVV